VENDHIAGVQIIEMNKILKGICEYGDGVISAALCDAFIPALIHNQISFHYLLSTMNGDPYKMFLYAWWLLVRNTIYSKVTSLTRTSHLFYLSRLTLQDIHKLRDMKNVMNYA